MIKEAKFHLAKIPLQLRWFLLKAITAFSLWSLVYNLYLLPGRIIDCFVTDSVAMLTKLVLKLLYADQYVEIFVRNGSPIICINKVGTLTILDGCNGLELFVVYTGFILCMPSKPKVMFNFFWIGIVSLFSLNVLRCVLLAFMEHVRFTYIDTMHHYIFTMIVYSFIFSLWVMYLKHSTVSGFTQQSSAN